MNAVSMLRKNMELKLNMDLRFSVFEVGGDVLNTLSSSHIEKLKNESEEIIDRLFKVSGYADSKNSNISVVKYILSNDKLFTKFKNAKSDTVFSSLIGNCGINKKISADELAKFNLVTASKLFSFPWSVDGREYSKFLLYIAEKLNLYDAQEDIIDSLHKTLKPIGRDITNKESSVNKEEVLEVLDFSLKTGILKYLSKYESLLTAKKSGLTDTHIEYIKFLGENTDCLVDDLKLKEFSQSDVENLLNLVKSIQKILLEKSDKLIYDTDVFANFYESSLKNELVVKSIVTMLHDFDFNQKEINTLNYKLNNGEDINFVFDGFDELEEYLYFGLLKFIYPNFIETEKEIDSLRKMNLMHYTLQNNKKKFLKTLRESNVFDKLSSPFSVMLDESVFLILNLNTLTTDDIKELVGENKETLIKRRGFLYTRGGDYADDLSKILLSLGIKNISLEELKFLLKSEHSAIYIWTYLKAIGAGDEIKKTSQIPSLDLKTSTIPFMEVFESVSSEFSYNKELEKVLRKIDKRGEYPTAGLSLIAELIKDKPFKDRIFEVEKFIGKSNVKLTNYDWLKYFLLEDVNYFKHQIKNESDVLFFVRYYEEFKNSLSSDFEAVKKSIYASSSQYKDFVKTINPSDEFLKENEERIYEFFLNGLMDVFLTYHKDLKTSTVKNNLAMITKAEVAGKLNDIKYYPGDLEREIGYPISSNDETLWMKNTALTFNDYKVAEKSDYKTIIQLGIYPVRTCMAYNGGMYNECLLSNFDANKKVITVSKGGKIVARAILRLTKISDTKLVDNYSRGLGFKDIESIDESVKNHGNEKLVLFLERCYTNSNDVTLMREYMVKLAFKKAKEMGIRLILSNNYIGAVDYKYKAKSYIYISKSKNGKQYLDSFGGETTNDKTEYVKLSGSHSTNPVLLPSDEMYNALYDTKKQ